MKMLKYCLILIVLSVTNICTADSPEMLLEKAENIRLQTVKAGFEWTTISILISEAKQAAEAGNNELAEKLANAAIKQAESALKQAEYAAANWQNSEPK